MGEQAMFSLRAVVLLAASSASRADAQSARDTLAVETLAVRAMVGKFVVAAATVDSLFAQPDQAPPAMTGVSRPAARQRALAEAAREARRDAKGDSLRVRVSNPSFRGDVARISITVDQFSVRARRRGAYETVVFTIARMGDRWVVRERVQLGIS